MGQMERVWGKGGIPEEEQEERQQTPIGQQRLWTSYALNELHNTSLCKHKPRSKGVAISILSENLRVSTMPHSFSQLPNPTFGPSLFFFFNKKTATGINF